jgi:hypothetical protein
MVYADEQTDTETEQADNSLVVESSESGLVDLTESAEFTDPNTEQESTAEEPTDSKEQEIASEVKQEIVSEESTTPENEGEITLEDSADSEAVSDESVDLNDELDVAWSEEQDIASEESATPEIEEEITMEDSTDSEAVSDESVDLNDKPEAISDESVNPDAKLEDTLEESDESKTMLTAVDSENEAEQSTDTVTTPVETSLTLTNIELDTPDGVNDTFGYQIYIWTTSDSGYVSPIKGTYGDATFTSKSLYYYNAYSMGLPYNTDSYYTYFGYTTIYLESGQSVTIPNLPEGCNYYIVAAASANYYVKSLTSTYGTVDDQIGTVTVNGASGPNKVVCVNDYAPNSLRISEEVISSNPNSVNDTFTFTIYLYSHSSSKNTPLFDGDSVKVDISTDSQDGVESLNLGDTLTFTKTESITLPGLSISGTYNMATVTLKHGQSIVLKHLGSSYGCYIAQTPDPHYKLYQLKTRHVYVKNMADFSESYDNQYTYIDSCSVSSSVGFVNSQENLSITKKVEGSDTTREFTFNVYIMLYSFDTGRYFPLGDDTYELTYTNPTGNEAKTVQFKTGTKIAKTLSGLVDYTNSTYTAEFAAAQIKVAAGQTVTIKDLPTWICYYIEEVPVDNYTLTDLTTTDDEASMSVNDGALYNWYSQTDASATFTNTFTPENGIDLTISKTVTGFGDQTRKFPFRIILTDGDGNPLSDRDIMVKLSDGTETVYTTDANGALTVYLKHGQTVTLEDLPAGTKYSIEERDANGYTTTFYVSGNEATETKLLEGTLDATKSESETVQVNNDYSLVVPTGIKTENRPFAYLFGGSAAALLLLLIEYRLRRKHR